MKLVCFFICFLAVALAEEQAKTPFVPHTDEDIERATTECKKELGIYEPNKHDDIELDQLPCFFFCAYKKIRVMHENATVNMDVINYIYESPEENQIMRQMMENCEKLVDGCKVAKCVHAVDFYGPAYATRLNIHEFE